MNMPKICIITFSMNARGGRGSHSRSRNMQWGLRNLSRSMHRRLSSLSSRGKFTVRSHLQFRSPIGMNLVRRSIHSKSRRKSIGNDATKKSEDISVIPNQSSKQHGGEVHKSSKEVLSENNCMEEVMDGEDNDVNLEREEDKSVCPVCLDQYVQPIQLPCSHIFCFLCAKGLQQGSGKCALCRKAIPAKLIKNPKLLAAEPSSTATDDTYGWFYQGKEGWWQYDDRTAAEIEDAFQKKENMCEVMIAGSLYIIDFQTYRQIRKDQPFRNRKIKRDLISVFKKGVAGVKF